MNMAFNPSSLMAFTFSQGNSAVAVEVLGARSDLLARQRLDALQQHPFLVVEGEAEVQSFEDVHGS